MTLTQEKAVTRKPSAERKYRVIQWGVGNVGTVALRHFAHNPAYELVGVLCNRPEKVGKDAGELFPLSATPRRGSCPTTNSG
jgi:2,4-diaminopentanoate dehydrogenase